MATKKSKALDPPDEPGITWRGSLSLEQRESMIREAAYYHYVRRGFAHGHDVEDWLAAEVEIDVGIPEPGRAGSVEYGMQQSGVHGAAKDDALKRIVRQHPQKGIPQIESVEPREAPPKE